MAYVIQGEDLYCALHDEKFERTSACTGCVATPSSPIDREDDPADPPPHGCVSTEQLERDFTAIGDEMRDHRRSLACLGVKDAGVYNSIVKLADCEIKARRQAAAMATRREDEAIVRRREAEKRALESAH